MSAAPPDPRDRLTGLLATLSAPALDPRVNESVQRLALKFGNQCAAVLFYGSCLRTGQVSGMMLDFYVLVDDYRAAHGGWLPALANRLAPPNVYYFETDIDGQTVRAKYAVLTLAHFRRLAGPGTFNTAIWARFAQPVALAYCRDQAARAAVIEALADAHVTLLGRAQPLAQTDLAADDPLTAWRQAFGLTYGCEFRAESAGRPGAIVDANADYYRRVGPLAQAALAADGRIEPMSPAWARWQWRWRRVEGRARHIARLVTAAFTFAGGVDYLAWKIQRHSGVAVTVKDWHRRHPLLAGLWLFMRLRLQRAFR